MLSESDITIVAVVVVVYTSGFNKMNDERRDILLTEVIELARKNVEEGGGRPFACLIIDDNGKEIARKEDMVQQTGDPIGQVSCTHIMAPIIVNVHKCWVFFGRI